MLFSRKGEYPYEFVSRFDKLDTPLSELKREDFYSSLKKEHLTNEQLEHVREVIKAFKFKTLKQYHDLYLAIDVSGLADVIQNYRDITMQTYGLDPCQFIGTPGLSWSAGLKKRV